MRLSLCLIARNEEAFLADCLDSVRGVVDEIVVVDTGSTDGTAAIARARGARVVHQEWSHDFAAARNTSLAAARGDVAFVLDADERFVGGDVRVAAEDLLRRSPVACGRVEIVNEPMGSRVLVTRLVPLDGRHRFHGRVHEQVLRDGSEPQRIATAVTVRHLGYAPDVVAARSKLGRNVELLEREVAEHPEDAYLAYQLGRTLLGAGRAREAHAALERALVLLPADAPFAAHLVESLGYALRTLGRSTEALRLVEPVAAAFAERSDTQFVAALLALDLGHLERARRGFLRCLDLAGATPPGGEHDPATAGAAAAHNLGVMAEVQGRVDEARGWYERALATCSGHAASRAGLARLAAPARS